MLSNNIIYNNIICKILQKDQLSVKNRIYYQIISYIIIYINTAEGSTFCENMFVHNSSKFIGMY